MWCGHRPLSRVILEPAAWLANEAHVQFLFVELAVSLISGELRQHSAGDNVRTPGIRVPTQGW